MNKGTVAFGGHGQGRCVYSWDGLPGLPFLEGRGTGVLLPGLGLGERARGRAVGPGGRTGSG